MNLKHSDIIFALIFIVVFAGAFGTAMTFPTPVLPGDPGAGFFPKLISIASLIFCFLLLAKRVLQLRSAEKDHQPTLIESGFGSFVIITGSVVCLLLGMHYIGSELSFFAFLFILLGMRTKRWVWSFVISVISSAVIYIVFVALLNVHLPVLFLPKYITFG